MKNLNNLFIDYETRSPVDLKRHGLARYARDPGTEVLMMAYAFGDEPTQLWEPGQTLPARVRQHVGEGGLVVAHNASFEHAIWAHVMTPRFNWPALSIRQLRCTVAMSHSQALPGALKNAASALGLDIGKDTEGRTLMLKMCKPQADGTYYDTPEARKRLGEYCRQDVEVERQIYKRVLPLTKKEQALWELDQTINLRGAPFDLPSIRGALQIAEVEKERLNAEMAKVTQGAVTACSNVGSLKEWAADFGVMPDSLAKAELADLLTLEDLPEPVRAALKLRQEASRFTSISKLNAILDREVNGRVSYGYQYHAATTGRWAGRGVQLQNFTRDLPESAQVEDILRLCREGDATTLLAKHGSPATMISKSLRGFIHAAPGKQLIGGDFANIEGRGIAWLAGQDDKLTAFRSYDSGSGPDLYKIAYSKSFHVPINRITDSQRQIGKVMELAFGYQGGVGAFRTMAKTLGVKVSEEQADEFKFAWRDAHPLIEAYWKDLQDAAFQALRSPGSITYAGHSGRHVACRKNGSFLWCRLPSGRALCYPYPAIVHDSYGARVSFKSVPDAVVWSTYKGQKERGETNTTYIVDDPNNSKEWCRVSTYGGKLSENITQAICRDILAEAMLRLEAAGFKVVSHVHDEIIVEGDFKPADLERFKQIMTETPAWAEGFPIAASCWMSPRYIKEK